MNKRTYSLFLPDKKKHIMELNSLTAISPVDGRYHSKTKELAPYLSEFALIKYRTLIEIEYFIELCEIPLPQLTAIDPSIFPKLRAIYENFSEADAQKIKDIERITNHDVKAVEYFIKEQFDLLGLSKYKEFIHFALTSQDINNTAVPLSLKHAMAATYAPLLQEILEKLEELAAEWTSIPMLARTHGQAASPTLLGKEIRVFIERLTQQGNQLNNIPPSAKFGGATGNFNAHYITYPSIDWVSFANRFVNENLGLSRSQYTTQIEHYDNMASLFHSLIRINTIFIDLARDCWTYISMDYFKQKVVKGEVGSSAMPHKVNPIDFENGEGNLGIANAIFEHMAKKLPVSRLQRDLTDSTVLRNVGVPLGHTLIAFKSILKGLNKLKLNADKIQLDLEANWAVVAEAIQNILRREGFDKPYEALKELTRGKAKIGKEDIHSFIQQLNVSEEVREELMQIRPDNYIGMVK